MSRVDPMLGNAILSVIDYHDSSTGEYVGGELGEAQKG
jgi:hypothetical protein